MKQDIRNLLLVTGFVLDSIAAFNEARPVYQLLNRTLPSQELLKHGDMALRFAELVAKIGQFGPMIAVKFVAIAAELYIAGANMMSQLWEGMKSIGSTIVGWASGLGGRIMGAFSWGGAGAAQSAPAAGGPALPGRAGGGPVQKGRSYIVGEERAEVFTPTQSGTIGKDASKIGGSSPSFSFVNTWNVAGVSNPAEFAEKVEAQLRERIRFATRGVYADV
jgi:hypothetical protein